MKEKLKEKLHILGENIRRYREKSDMTIQELATITKLRKEYLIKIEKGNAYRISTYHIFILAKAFNISPHEIIKNL